MSRLWRSGCSLRSRSSKRGSGVERKRLTQAGPLGAGWDRNVAKAGRLLQKTTPTRPPRGRLGLRRIVIMADPNEQTPADTKEQTRSSATSPPATVLERLANNQKRMAV